MQLYYALLLCCPVWHARVSHPCPCILPVCLPARLHSSPLLSFQMLTNSRERFEKIAKELPEEQKHLLVQVESAEAASNCKVHLALN